MKASVLECLSLIYQEGSTDSQLKKDRIRKKLKKWKNGDWDKVVSTLDRDWQWRLACAKLHLGELSWDGFNFRNIRGGMIPFYYPHWSGQKVKNLLVFGEQGIGDEVMFAQCLPFLKDYAENITFECRKRLEPIFKRSFPEFEIIGRKSFDDGSWTNGRHFDSQIPLGSLPAFFFKSKKSFPKKPYLYPDHERVAELYLPEGKKVGVSWHGRQARIDPELLREDGHIFSLQYGEEDHLFINPQMDLTNDIEGVFALTSLMDKVVSVPTSLVHFAGSMGIETHVIQCDKKSSEQNSAINWRFSPLHNGGNKMLWHPSVQIYRNIKEYRSKHVNQ